MNIMELAKQARLRRHQEQAPGIDGVVGNWKELEVFAALVAAHERAWCAKLCEELAKTNVHVYYQLGVWECIEAIRARSNT